MSRYILQDTKSGARTLSYRDAREVRIHSAYDPVREAERSVAAFNPGRASIIVVCGLGLAYHVSALRAKFPGRAIIAVEHDAEVVDLARGENPQSLEGTAIVCSPRDLGPIFETGDLTSFRGTAIYHHRPSYQLYPEFYDSIIRDIAQYISSKLSDLLTRFEFEELWIGNIFSNIHHLFDSTPVRELFGKFSGYPGIIVSAGPSLRKNVALLAEARDRALIVCVDTALKILLAHGITPHLVMTLDAQKHSIKHFLGIRNHGAILLADLVSYPPLLRDYSGERIISTTSKYYTDAAGDFKRETTPAVGWIENYCPPAGDIQSGGSVATSVFDFLLNLGCSSIILVGQDLAYTGREIHCSGTHHNEDWNARTNRFMNLDTINQNVIRKRKIKYVEAFGGEGTVISDFVFDLYKGWFEDSAAKVPIPVINATGGGARIKNTREMTLRQAIDSMPRAKTAPAEILSRYAVTGPSENAAPLRDAVTAAIAEIEALRDIAAKRTASGDASLDGEIERLLLREAPADLLSPFLKRTQIFLARKADVSDEKAKELYARDIASAAARLLPSLRRAKKNLERI